MTIGERIKERMDAMDLSQAELARRVGISQPSIYGLINTNKTGSRHLHLVARELETTVAYLTGETDDPASHLADDDLLSNDEREWVELLRTLEPADRKTILQLARSLAQNAATSATVHSPKSEYRAER